MDKFNLTEREQEVLRLLFDGKENEEIAQILFVKTSTVKAHISSILYKMNVKNRTQAVVAAIKNEMIMIKKSVVNE